VSATLALMTCAARHTFIIFFFQFKCSCFNMFPNLRPSFRFNYLIIAIKYILRSKHVSYKLQHVTNITSTTFLGSQGCVKCGFALSTLVDAQSSVKMVTLLGALSHVIHYFNIDFI